MLEFPQTGRDPVERLDAGDLPCLWRMDSFEMPRKSSIEMFKREEDQIVCLRIEKSYRASTVPHRVRIFDPL